MKNLNTILIMLVAVGCGKNEAERLEDSVVGTYEIEEGRFVLLANGKVKSFEYGEEIRESAWKIVGKEVHVGAVIYRIKKNRDLTVIAAMVDLK